MWNWRRRPRGGVEDTQLVELISLLDSVSLSDSDDKWIWELDTDDAFSVKGVRSYLDRQELPEGNIPTRWNKFVPRKVNIMIWRLLLDRLSTRFNLSRKGFDIPSILCPICLNSVEVLDHIFGGCHLTSKIWNAIGRWLDVSLPGDKGPKSILELLDSSGWVKKKKDVIEVIIYTTWWIIWRARNEIIFGQPNDNKDTLFDSIVSVSYL
ncbi:uncharacterized protein LOC143535410 [Bidens hawaiensis]|uniref:uncharacterized protein LOC143535410 n=1 Tax=Bidens hawaiensis TaxID=980011 RepID=UPI00404B02A1